jgi:hypothetical protein
MKPGVDAKGIRNEILLALQVLSSIFAEHPTWGELVVTSLLDGEHMDGSLHYQGLAVDVRTRNIPPASLPILESESKTRLGVDYDVVLEADHLHVEFDPKD